jgi:hypothetical protein
MSKIELIELRTTPISTAETTKPLILTTTAAVKTTNLMISTTLLLASTDVMQQNETVIKYMSEHKKKNDDVYDILKTQYDGK